MATKIWEIKKVQDDGRVFIDMPSSTDSPCSTCGACCSHYRVSFYFGELDDHPGGFIPSAMATDLGGFRACMSGTETGGRCSALRGEIGSGPISGAIYDSRPSSCREFPVWEPDGSPNPSCQQLREKIGLAPLENKPQEVSP